jgi:hypothetical protein
MAKAERPAGVAAATMVSVDGHGGGRRSSQGARGGRQAVSYFPKGWKGRAGLPQSRREPSRGKPPLPPSRTRAPDRRRPWHPLLCVRPSHPRGPGRRHAGVPERLRPDRPASP